MGCSGSHTERGASDASSTVPVPTTECTHMDAVFATEENMARLFGFLDQYLAWRLAS